MPEEDELKRNMEEIRAAPRLGSQGGATRMVRLCVVATTWIARLSSVNPTPPASHHVGRQAPATVDSWSGATWTRGDKTPDGQWFRDENDATHLMIWWRRGVVTTPHGVRSFGEGPDATVLYAPPWLPRLRLPGVPRSLGIAQARAQRRSLSLADGYYGYGYDGAAGSIRHSAHRGPQPKQMRLCW